MTSLLMEATDLSDYLLNPMIDREDAFGTYAAAYLGWSSECADGSVTLLAMDGDKISCNLESSCQGLSCAVDSPFTGRTFEFFMRLRQCDYMMEVGIERQKYNRTLKGYNWGQWTEVDLNGILRMR